MACVCPTCGGEMQDVPAEALLAVPMPAQAKLLLRALVKAWPRGVDKARIVDALWGSAWGGGPMAPSNQASVQMVQLRRLLAPYGWTVSKGKGGRGAQSNYRLVRT